MHYHPRKRKNSCIQAHIFIQKIYKISRIHKCIFQKKRTKSKSKTNSCIQACILIHKIHMHSYMHSSKIIKQKKASFMHS